MRSETKESREFCWALWETEAARTSVRHRDVRHRDVRHRDIRHWDATGTG